MQRKYIFSFVLFIMFATGALWLALAFNRGWLGEEPFSIKVIHDLGPEKAREVFREKGIKTGSDHAVFGVAWSDFMLGNYESAEKACHHLLTGGNPEGRIKASCWYLLGHIYVQQERYDLAQINFDEAIKRFGPETFNGIRAQLGMVLLKIKMEQYEDARDILAGIDPEVDPGVLPADLTAYWYVLRAQIAFWGENDLNASLAQTIRAVEWYDKTGDRSAMASQISTGSFLRMRLGDWDGGTFDASRAKGILLAMDQHHELAYNAAAWYYRSRCYPHVTEGEQSTAEKAFEAARKQAEASTDDYLNQFLDLADSCDCPE